MSWFRRNSAAPVVVEEPASTVARQPHFSVHFFAGLASVKFDAELTGDEATALREQGFVVAGLKSLGATTQMGDRSRDELINAIRSALPSRKQVPPDQLQVVHSEFGDFVVSK